MWRNVRPCNSNRCFLRVRRGQQSEKEPDKKNKTERRWRFHCFPWLIYHMIWFTSYILSTLYRRAQQNFWLPTSLIFLLVPANTICIWVSQFDILYFICYMYEIFYITGGTISLTIPKLKNMEKGLLSPHWLATSWLCALCVLALLKADRSVHRSVYLYVCLR